MRRTLLLAAVVCSAARGRSARADLYAIGVRIVIFSALAAVVSKSARAVTPPAIFNLGTLGGNASIGYGINDIGQVAGWSQLTDTTVVHAFLYAGTPGSDGAMADLGTVGGRNSQGYAVNNIGQVTGYSITSAGDEHAFLYSGAPGSGGTMYDVGTLGTQSIGEAINDSGIVVGTNYSTQHAFMYKGIPGSGGHMIDLGTLGGTQSEAYGINAGGQVVGFSTLSVTGAAHAFVYSGVPGSGGAMADLGTLGGGFSYGRAINNAAEVAGYSFLAGNATQHAFLYTGTPGAGGHMMDLGTLGGTNSYGEAINGAGQIVGYSDTSNGGQHGFVYVGTPGVDGNMIDLDAWLKANDQTDGSKWTLLTANGVNDTGLITGQGFYNGDDFSGNFAYLLDANALLVPEPASFVLLGIGAALIVAYRCTLPSPG
jgi:probable HAF family extracellular repeat protein